MEASILLGDSREVLKGLEAESFDSMVTDPPAGIAFMGSEWDNHTLDGFEELLYEVFVEAYRVLKPGSHILVWSIPRTSHRTARAIERAGFVIRDALDNIKDRSPEVEAFLLSLTEEQRELLLRASPADSFLLHLFGQGFPKNLNLKKALTKQGRVEEAQKWGDWGTGLKPAVETWWLARKPLQEKTVIKQVLATGTGAININGSRVYTDWNEADRPDSWKASGHTDKPEADKIAAPPGQGIVCHPEGRWPTNLVLQHGSGCKRIGERALPKSDPSLPEGLREGIQAIEAGDASQGIWECAPGCPIQALDEQSGALKSGSGNVRKKAYSGYQGGDGVTGNQEVSYGDSGGASRFFNTFEPDLETIPFYYTGKIKGSERKEDLEEEGLINEHPTVKTKKLMAHLVKLITPPGGKVLDPFAGSGSTIVAALGEGFSGLGVEQKELFYQIATKRVLRALGREQSAQAAREDFDFMMGLESE